MSYVSSPTDPFEYPLNLIRDCLNRWLIESPFLSIFISRMSLLNRMAAKGGLPILPVRWMLLFAKRKSPVLSSVHPSRWTWMAIDDQLGGTYPFIRRQWRLHANQEDSIMTIRLSRKNLASLRDKMEEMGISFIYF